MTKRALISVTDKSGVVEFARSLNELGYEVISTGNTFKTLKEEGLKVIQIDEVTNFPEILDGRVKTLNPYIHGGILYKRDNEKHVNTVNEHKIGAIDLVVVNLYDFEGNLKDNKSHDVMIENIDIGGPSMIRSAAKNYKDVLIVVDTKDYDSIIESLKAGEVSLEDRKKLAYKAFSTTARYDALISNYFREQLGDKFPESLTMTFQKEDALRYGENPHQGAVLYKQSNAKNPILNYEQLNGKELSFNNINDLHGCLEIMREFKDSEQVACVAIKHTNPCGVAVAKNSFEAYTKCYEADKVSIFGGIVGFTSVVDVETAKKLNEIFLEIVVAYDFTKEALEVLTQKKNLRVLKLSNIENSLQGFDLKYLDGKLLVQDRDEKLANEYNCVTNEIADEQILKDMEFGMKIVKNMKSNAIAIVKDGQTLALGCGQTSRIWALKNALENNQDKNFEGAVLASDAFFPFDDCVKLANDYKIKSIVQPGGSIKDQDSIDACNENDMVMVFTGIRHFKH
ncbi:bifunctional phosphoribosylaminoimidazolecarboxamide formyltransferase/IMP cyclohydrolase [Paraclostridium bifermentans]|uniref:bifunctional phosphoribosylaminoimidazolecarboxamide formyltransferase/IMP cyclohydrolase n=1 Tax=Paraclostridium TaxID=1849822 RepID=UPI001243254B|nr:MULTISPECIES: bifunctional phosphoribosylaminoimidazolecarboxamide formyltransferase/IMP cyclohydrolase [Paraclostridium]MBZ6006448.1 bifunctional phosphoribosylaminoimidazolecarboxamide formyltransferase/IMP cyclohydrolase [Paraclostridium bifermentans]MDU0298151.1 bifunctional phosphoribosylaminoimidazolecarboxamide formyltransferase/IMP cyclohydrolase [Paraclostridium sp. MRS3W1]